MERDFFAFPLFCPAAAVVFGSVRAGQFGLQHSRAPCDSGNLNVGVLEQSLKEIVPRHESLRMTFSMVDGEPVQVIAPSVKLSSGGGGSQRSS